MEPTAANLVNQFEGLSLEEAQAALHECEAIYEETGQVESAVKFLVDNGYRTKFDNWVSAHPFD